MWIYANGQNLRPDLEELSNKDFNIENYFRGSGDGEVRNRKTQFFYSKLALSNSIKGVTISAVVLRSWYRGASRLLTGNLGLGREVYGLGLRLETTSFSLLILFI